MSPDVASAPTRVLLALIRVHQRDGRATVRQVAVEAGLGSSVTFWHLQRLDRMGLVSSTPGRNGTLRPTVMPVQVWL